MYVEVTYSRLADKINLCILSCIYIQSATSIDDQGAGARCLNRCIFYMVIIKVNSADPTGIDRQGFTFAGKLHEGTSIRNKVSSLSLHLVSHGTGPG